MLEFFLTNSSSQVLRFRLSQGKGLDNEMKSYRILSDWGEYKTGVRSTYPPVHDGESLGYKNRNVRDETLYLLQKAIYRKR